MHCSVTDGQTDRRTDDIMMPAANHTQWRNNRVAAASSDGALTGTGAAMGEKSYFESERTQS